MKCENCIYCDKEERICYYTGENRCVDNVDNKEQTEDAISREQAKAEIRKAFSDLASRIDINSILNELPSVTPKQSNFVLCKDCKYFEYDSVAKVDDIPLIVAHEICKRWGDGCKTDENGWCFLAEKREG